MVAYSEKKLKEQDLTTILEALVVYILRRRLFGSTAGENKAVPKMSAKIDELVQATDKAAKMFELLCSQEYKLRLPNDSEVGAQLLTMNFYNNEYAKLLLTLVEYKMTKARPNIKAHDLLVERIMPQVLSESWTKSVTPEVHQQYLNNIGNISLIVHDQEIGNIPFEDKKLIYSAKGVLCNATIFTDVPKWNEEAIAARRDWMVQFIVEQVLPLPDQFKTSHNWDESKNKGKKKDNKRFSFREVDLIGGTIQLVDDKKIKAEVVSDTEVKFGGRVYKLTTLTRELYKIMKKIVKLEGYQGSQYWEHDGTTLKDIADQKGWKQITEDIVADENADDSDEE
jgi:hypothetical protein